MTSQVTQERRDFKQVARGQGLLLGLKTSRWTHYVLTCSFLCDARLWRGTSQQSGGTDSGRFQRHSRLVALAGQHTLQSRSGSHLWRNADQYWMDPYGSSLHTDVRNSHVISLRYCYNHKSVSVHRTTLLAKDAGKSIISAYFIFSFLTLSKQNHTMFTFSKDKIL